MTIQHENKHKLSVYDKMMVGTRIKERREELKLSRVYVIDRIEVSLTTLQAWEMGEREASITGIFKLAEVLKTTPEFLLKGIKPTGIVENAFNILEQNRAANDDYIELPAYEDVAVSAGNGGFNEDVTAPTYYMPFKRSILQKLGLTANNAAVFWADGISMLPTIHDKDMLLVNMDQKQINDGKIYLVQNNGILWVKRVKIGWDKIELISDNHELYEPIVLPFKETENINVIGQVVSVSHSLI